MVFSLQTCNIIISHVIILTLYNFKAFSHTGEQRGIDNVSTPLTEHQDSCKLPIRQIVVICAFMK